MLFGVAFVDRVDAGKFFPDFIPVLWVQHRIILSSRVWLFIVGGQLGRGVVLVREQRG